MPRIDFRSLLASALGIGAFFCFGVVPSSVLAAESHPGLEAEATYSEAVIAYHQRKLQLSIKIIEKLLKSNPDYLSALELKALSLKELGQEKERIPLLQKILEVKPREERGALYFELALLLQKNQRLDEARVSFEAAADLGFNEVPARLVAGMIAFNAGDMGGAERQMKLVKRLGSTEMEMAGAYYLGLINFKRGNGGLGASYLLEARGLAQKNPHLPLSQQLSQPIEQVLEPFQKSQWFMNLSLLSQYDSNILQIPTSASAQQGTSQSAPKSTMLAGFGYMQAPLSTFQWVPSFRFNANKNFGSGLEAYEYANNTLALAINYQPLARISASLKGELTHTFQNNEGSYRSYTALADFGPQLKWIYSEDLQLIFEASVRPLINFAQHDFGGTGQGYRLSYRREGASRNFNPTMSLSVDSSGTRDLNYRSVAKAVSVSNLIRLSGDHQLTPGLDLVFTDYSDALPIRHDKTLAARVSWAKPVSSSWTALGDLSFTWNASNLSGSYTYQRWVGGFGLSYSR